MTYGNIYFLACVNVKRIFNPKNADHGGIYAVIFKFDNLLKIKYRFIQGS